MRQQTSFPLNIENLPGKFFEDKSNKPDFDEDTASNEPETEGRRHLIREVSFYDCCLRFFKNNLTIHLFYINFASVSHSTQNLFRFSYYSIYA